MLNTKKVTAKKRTIKINSSKTRWMVMMRMTVVQYRIDAVGGMPGRRFPGSAGVVEAVPSA